jgi:hypothetical protein
MNPTQKSRYKGLIVPIMELHNIPLFDDFVNSGMMLDL